MQFPRLTVRVLRALHEAHQRQRKLLPLQSYKAREDWERARVWLQAACERAGWDRVFPPPRATRDLLPPQKRKGDPG